MELICPKCKTTVKIENGRIIASPLSVLCPSCQKRKDGDDLWVLDREKREVFIHAPKSEDIAYWGKQGISVVSKQDVIPLGDIPGVFSDHKDVSSDDIGNFGFKIIKLDSQNDAGIVDCYHYVCHEDIGKFAKILCAIGGLLLLLLFLFILVVAICEHIGNIDSIYKSLGVHPAIILFIILLSSTICLWASTLVSNNSREISRKVLKTFRESLNKVLFDAP